jgi:hypothetical protein
MYLMSKVSLTLKKIESNERKSSSVKSTVHSDVLAQHESHIRVNDKSDLGIADCVPSRSHASDVRDPDKTIEIRYRRWLVALPG